MTVEDRGITIGRDAYGNVIVSGDNNVVIYQTVHQQVIHAAENPRPVEVELGPNPFLGLSAFHEQDAKFFFGRERLIDQLWEAFSQLHAGAQPKFLALLGPSGSGKSSLARAGLIPELAGRPLDGWRESRIAVMTPGEMPLHALAAVMGRVKRASGDQESGLESEFLERLGQRNGSGRYDGLLGIANGLPEIQSRPVVIFVDQFEELFSLCKDDAVQRIFLSNLLDACSSPGGRVSVIITMRSDFLGDTQGHEELNRLICDRQHSCLVPAMTIAGLRRSIVEPARMSGHELDGEVVAELVDYTSGHGSALPLLQFALFRIWEGLRDGCSARKTLTDIDGIGGALAERAQKVFDGLDDRGCRIARRAFLAMIDIDDRSRDVRRPVAIDNLVASRETIDEVKQVLRLFADFNSRLITLSSDGESELCEVTHESLFDHWVEFQDWVDAGKKDLKVLRRLEDAVKRWQDQGKPAGSLWRPPDLQQLATLHTSCAADMTASQIEFFEASQDAHDELVRREAKEASLQELSKILRGVEGGKGLDEIVPEFLRRLLNLIADSKAAALGMLDGRELTVRWSEAVDGEEAPTEFSPVTAQMALDSDEGILCEEIDAEGHKHSVVCVRLTNSQSESIGVLSVRAAAGQLTETDREMLSNVAPQSGLAIDNLRLRDSARQNTDLTSELTIAGDVLRGFLPEPPDVEGFSFAYSYVLASWVGGDFFDFHEFEDGRVVVIIGDAVGRSVSASLLMASTVVDLRRILSCSDDDVATALAELNRSKVWRQVERFVTIAIVSLHRETGEMSIVNAGHLTPICRRASGEVLALGEDEAGFPIGIVDNHEYETYTGVLDVGDSLVLHTDGLNEAMTEDQTMYSLERVRRVIAESTGQADQIVNSLVEDLEQFRNGYRDDDVCIVAVSRNTD